MQGSAIVIGAALLARALLVERFTVTTGSMVPLLHPGQRVWVDKTAYVWRAPERWELIVFRGPDGRPYVKRVVGLPGECVQVKDGVAWINGERSANPDPSVSYVAEGRHGVHAPCRLGDDEYFVLGDNSAASDDSRTWPNPGVPAPAVIGRPMLSRR